MGNFEFWRKWLFAITLIMAVFGILMAFLNQTPLFDTLFNDPINGAIWENENDVTPEVRDFQQWVYGVTGGVMAGWSLMMAFIVHYPFKNKEKWAWQALTYSLLIWFVVDEGFSLYLVPFNAVFNLGLVILIAPPLFFTRNEFQ